MSHLKAHAGFFSSAVQLVYKPFFWTWVLVFGPYWQLWVKKSLNISDQLFSGVAFSTYCSICTKKLHNISYMKNDFWFIFELFLNFFVPQNRLPLRLNRECKAQRGFIDCLYIIALGLFRLLYERGFFILMYCDNRQKNDFLICNAG